MKKMDLLSLLESEKKSLLKNVSVGNSDKIIGLFEASGLLKKGESSNPTEKAPTRSKRPDIMEMDASSKGGIYDASVREEPTKNTPSVKNTQSEPVNPATKETKKAEKKQPIKSAPSEPKKEEPLKSSSKGIVDKSSGYPEIQLTEDLKDIDEKDLDNILTKSEMDSVLNANNDVKTDIFRNLLLTKKADFGGSSEYECFTTGKGGAKMVKGTVPDTYISKYYTSTSEMQRPETKESYLILTAKLKGSDEKLTYMVLPDNAKKYIVFTTISNNNSEYITVLDESQFNMLFHQAKND